MKILPLLLAVCVAGLSTAGCRKKPTPAAPSDPPSTTATKQEPKGAASPESEPPKPLPPGATLPPAPPAKAWALRNAGEKEMQVHYWLGRHEYGAPAERAQIIAAIQGAGLSAKERQELEDIRSRFGYRRLQY